jgi:urease accessory protein
MLQSGSRPPFSLFVRRNAPSIATCISASDSRIVPIMRVMRAVPWAPATRAAASPAIVPGAPGHARIGVIRSGSRSVVSRAHATSPLRLLTPANHGHAAWIYTSSLGGGLVDGDQIVMDIDVGRGAAAFISTQASTKIYRSPGGTSAEMHVRVGADGLLVVAPDPVVCFSGARYRQTQTFELADRAALVTLDWVSSGRHAAGERWAFDEYHGQISVRLDGRLLVHDVLALRSDDGSLRERLGRFNVLAIAVLAGTTLAASASALVAKASASPILKRPDQLVAATALGDHGCVVRFADTSFERVGRTIREFLSFLPALLGDDPWIRKW